MFPPPGSEGPPDTRRPAARCQRRARPACCSAASGPVGGGRRHTVPPACRGRTADGDLLFQQEMGGLQQAAQGLVHPALFRFAGRKQEIRLGPGVAQRVCHGQVGLEGPLGFLLCLGIVRGGQRNQGVQHRCCAGCQLGPGGCAGLAFAAPFLIQQRVQGMGGHGKHRQRIQQFPRPVQIPAVQQQSRQQMRGGKMQLLIPAPPGKFQPLLGKCSGLRLFCLSPPEELGKCYGETGQLKAELYVVGVAAHRIPHPFQRRGSVRFGKLAQLLQKCQQPLLREGGRKGQQGVDVCVQRPGDRGQQRHVRAAGARFPLADGGVIQRAKIFNRQESRRPDGRRLARI